MKYYAVRKGRNSGIYNTWEECSKEVIGFGGAEYKKFNSYEEALSFIENTVDVSKNFTSDLVMDIGDDVIVAYVDGSFSLELNIYSYGMVILTSHGKETFNGIGKNTELAEMRNVSGELKGALEAIKLAVDRNKKKLYLHYDYAGIEKWAVGEWKTNKMGTKMYKDFYDKMKDKIEVVFVKVKAHSGVEYNEEADQLAKKAIKEI